MKLISFWMLGLFGLAGCAGTQELPPSGPHPALTPDQVNLYQKPPAKFELLGVVSAVIPPSMTWDESGNANAGFDELKAAAAAQGANGILFDQNTNGATYTVNAGYNGTFYNVPMHRDPKTAVVKAIFVIKE